MITLSHRTTFHGPNPVAGAPVIVADLTISDGTLQSDVEVVTACERMRALRPEWFDGWSGPAPDSGAGARIGATLARWTLGALNEVRGFLHDAGARPLADGRTLVWVGFHDAKLSRQALELARTVFLRLVAQPDAGAAQFAAELDALWLRCRALHPDYQARILMQGARARGVPVLRFIDEERLWQFGWGARSRVFRESSSNHDGVLGSLLQKSKPYAKAAFRALGAPTPASVRVESPEALPAAAHQVGWPCVTKPTNAGGGSGVTANIRTPEALKAGFELARNRGRPVMVEAFVPGDDHRLMVIDGRLFAAIRRVPSWIIGDGRSTVRALIARENAERSTNMLRSRYLRPIPVDAALDLHLAAQSSALDHVPAPGARLTLRSNANLSTGGRCLDVTDQVHPQVRRMAEMIADAFGIGCAGLDYLTTDIRRPWTEVPGAFIEINTMPGLDAMIAAGQSPEAVGLAALGEIPGRVPLRLLAVPDADLARVADRLGERAWPGDAGWVCGDRAEACGVRLNVPSGAGWPAVNALLRNPAIGSIVLACGVDAMLRRGLPVDRADRIDVCANTVAPTLLRMLQRATPDLRRFGSIGDALSDLPGPTAAGRALSPAPPASATTRPAG